MPVIGWLVGRTVVEFIADYDHWVASVLLAREHKTIELTGYLI